MKNCIIIESAIQVSIDFSLPVKMHFLLVVSLLTLFAVLVSFTHNVHSKHLSSLEPKQDDAMLQLSLLEGDAARCKKCNKHDSHSDNDNDENDEKGKHKYNDNDREEEREPAAQQPLTRPPIGEPLPQPQPPQSGQPQSGQSQQQQRQQGQQSGQQGQQGQQQPMQQQPGQGQQDQQSDQQSGQQQGQGQQPGEQQGQSKDKDNFVDTSPLNRIKKLGFYESNIPSMSNAEKTKKHHLVDDDETDYDDDRSDDDNDSKYKAHNRADQRNANKTETADDTNDNDDEEKKHKNKANDYRKWLIPLLASFGGLCVLLSVGYIVKQMWDRRQYQQIRNVSAQPTAMTAP